MAGLLSPHRDHRTGPIGGPGLRRWTVWGIAVGAYVGAVVGRSSLAATGITAAHRFGVGSGVLSLLAVLQLAVYAALQVPAGALADRLGPRVMISIGAALVAVGQTVLALATGMPVAVGGRLLAGAGDAVTFVSLLRLVPSWFPPRQVPVVNQLSGLVGQLGQVLSAVPLAALVASSGWTSAYLSSAGFSVLVGLLAVTAVQDGSPPSRPGGPDPATAGFRAVLRNPGTRLGFWCHFVSLFSSNTIALLWGFPFLTAGEGLAAGTARGLLVLLVVVGIALGPVFGTLAARMPGRRVTIVAAVVATQIATWAVVLAWPAPVPPAVLVVLLMVLGIGPPASLVAFDVVRAAVGPDALGRASGMVNVGGYASTVLMVLLVGLALDVQGAGAPAAYSSAPFRVAMLGQALVWVVGLIGMARASRAVRRRTAGAPAAT